MRVIDTYVMMQYASLLRHDPPLDNLEARTLWENAEITKRKAVFP